MNELQTLPTNHQSYIDNHPVHGRNYEADAHIACDAIFNIYHYGDYAKMNHWDTFMSGMNPHIDDWHELSLYQQQAWHQAKKAWDEFPCLINQLTYDLDTGYYWHQDREGK